MNFGQILKESVLRTRSVLCFGLDPVFEDLPLVYRHGATPAVGILDFCHDAILATFKDVACYKLNSAFFEALGPSGWNVMHRIFGILSDLGVLGIWDSKRGDVSHSFQRYLSTAVNLGASAITCNLWLGLDCLQDYLASQQQHTLGLFPVVRSSNPGAAFLQDAIATIDGRQAPAYLHLARALNARNQDTLAGTDFGSLGGVVGALTPYQLAEVRLAMPNSWILIPGMGAQGGTAVDCASGFHPSGLGAVVNVSRGLTRQLPDTDIAPELRLRVKHFNDQLAQATTAGRLHLPASEESPP